MEENEEKIVYSEDIDSRVKETGEVFTPTKLVQSMLDDLGVDWDNPPLDRTFLEPTCGNGQFLAELGKRGIPISNIYGVDLMEDNVIATRKRLKEILIDSMDEKDLDFHLERNIVQADALTYHYDFCKFKTEQEKWMNF